MVGNSRHAASFSLACLYSFLCVTQSVSPSLSSKCSVGPEAMHGGYISQELVGSEASEMLQPNHS